jgi:hypothetical protein
VAPAHETLAWAFAPEAGAGLWLEPVRRSEPDSAGWAMVLSGELAVAFPRTEIRIAEHTVATAGAPLALFGAAFAGFF